ncbi:Hgh1 protein [Pichia kluyveri]|uniref:Protein HGH1 homolog n=1 Tax=Pichia kluyveri TaxID=36015 RepID=A0AAV5R891_PICKL|nr:Hgh1 protein [Pichia kluyveri]
MPSELEELVGFLHDNALNVREIALENLVQFSAGGPNNQQEIFKYDNCRAIEDLIKLTHEKKGKTVNEALTILVNLCDDEKLRELICKDTEFLKFIIEQLPNPVNINGELMCILLANLAKNDNILKVFDIKINILDSQKEIFKSDKAIDCLMDMFVKGSERQINKYVVYDYLSYFFADLSRFKKGREYFVTEQEYDNIIPLTKLLVFTEKYDAKVRREGVASTIKNSLFDIEKHMLFLDEPINLLIYILGPIALPGNKGLSDEEILELPDELQFLDEDKKMEPLKDIICVHLESLLLLCSTRQGRELLREKSVYPLIRELHKESNEEKLAELCDRLVQMLMRDEGEEKDKEEELNEIKDMLEKIEEIDVNEKEDEDESDDDDDDDIGQMIVVK